MIPVFKCLITSLPLCSFIWQLKSHGLLLRLVDDGSEAALQILRFFALLSVLLSQAGQLLATIARLEFKLSFFVFELLLEFAILILMVTDRSTRMLLLLEDLLLEAFHLGSLLSLEGLPLLLHLLPLLSHLIHILFDLLLLFRHPLPFAPCFDHSSLVAGLLVLEIGDLVLELDSLVL